MENVCPDSSTAGCLRWAALTQRRLRRDCPALSLRPKRRRSHRIHRGTMGPVLFGLRDNSSMKAHESSLVGWEKDRTPGVGPTGMWMDV